MQRYFSNEIKGNTFILSDNDVYHIFTVMRMNSEDLIEVVYNHELYICEVNVNNKKEVLIKKKVLSTVPINEVILVLPVLKEQKMDLVLQKATELGVTKIIPVITERSIVKVDGKEEKKIARWQMICKEASEQSKRLSIPTVMPIINLKDIEKDNGLNIVCSTTKESFTLKNLLHNKPLYDKITIVVGPEGGLSSKEEDMLINKGFMPISLGKLIMRVETVPIYILSIFNYINME
jgi:16S rRNA (uracil1498-N3)-methyltransferase